MAESEFQTRVLNDLTELKILVARLDERVKPLQESKREARGALLTALIAVGISVFEFFIRG